MRPVRYNVAASLDGYIAGPSGEFDWIPMEPAMEGVPAATRRPLGDDTLVVRITGWRPDSAGATLELRSLRMLVLGSGAHRCRTGGGAVEHFRVRPRGTEWIAMPVGPALAGDLGCTPIK